MRRVTRILALLGGLAAPVLLAQPVRAEMVVEAGLALSLEERQLIEQNPALAELAEVAPEALREVLDGIAAALANPSGTRGGLDDLDAADVRVLGQNPALLQVWRSSPEASADLLSLIRTAAGGGKPQK
jgi:hypothetical protein